VFAARMRELPLAHAFVEAFARGHGIDDDDDVLRLQLVVEELFTNTVQHGHGVECDEPIEIGLTAHDGVVGLHYRDAAPPHDPLSTLDESREALHASLDDRPIGGLGVPLVAGLVDRIDYTFEDGRNCVHVTLRVRPATP
jgi:serine/threonine-protein kinase RsbW